MTQGNDRDEMGEFDMSMTLDQLKKQGAQPLSLRKALEVFREVGREIAANGERTSESVAESVIQARAKRNNR
ncbi:hypothetical protein DNHGIG_24550 [Collibacillus ludicampi]|uniref:Uncharacterized protein n=1 Tax=Collibacillus ludicampi TaxID=2771369 RepID=A0AAV4LGE3_9BACL|nr:hypothetical protein [Collibacillus ludicampi]GIM46906.1 hypothetical protein DNHGIG_24550 [Collibacillus ludicampi]